jgi:hypothetical protein
MGVAPMQARHVRACFVVWILALTGGYYLWPGAHVFTWGAIGLSGAVGIVIGIRLNRPRNPLAWYLMAAAVLSFAAGDTIYYALQAIGPEPAFPGPADYFYLAVYPFLAASFLLFIRARSGGGNRAALIDALVPTVGLGLLTWVFLMAPYARDGCCRRSSRSAIRWATCWPWPCCCGCSPRRAGGRPPSPCSAPGSSAC